MDVDSWASPPTDLLVDIFQRLTTSDLVRCACTCKPWRRVIVGNASSLKPRPDHFLPDLLLGFFHEHYWWSEEGNVGLRLQPAPGPFESSILAASDDDDTPAAGCFIPAANNNAAVDLALYVRVLSSRDGFLLLDGRDGDGDGDVVVEDLCLCNPMTGACTLVPRAAAFPAPTYVLVSGYDDLNDGLGVRIVAVELGETDDGFLTTRHQVSSPMSTVAGGGRAAAGPPWPGPVMRSSPPSRMRVSDLTVYLQDMGIVCGGAIHWLVQSFEGTRRTFVVGLDVRTGRSWTTDVPEQCQIFRIVGYLALATSGDGRLSLAMLGPGCCSEIDVWVLVDDDGQWTRRPTIHVPNLGWMNCAFCQRSGCLLVLSLQQQELIVDVERGLSWPIRCLYPKDPDDCNLEIRYPYEMDWSTYLSRMKHF